MKLLRKIKCWMGWHRLAIALDPGFEHCKLNEFYIAAYGYKYCKHCGRRL